MVSWGEEERRNGEGARGDGARGDGAKRDKLLDLILPDSTKCDTCSI